jgi:RNA polymerase sigma factor (sigma-70 family)
MFLNRLLRNKRRTGIPETAADEDLLRARKSNTTEPIPKQIGRKGLQFIKSSVGVGDFCALTVQDCTVIDNRIEEAIDYHTSALAANFRLQKADIDDIRQELLLKYFEVLHEAEDASISYLKKCLANKAVDLARQFIKTRPTVSLNAIADAENGPDYEFLADTQSHDEISHSRQLDIEAVLQRLTARQRILCWMLMNDRTQQEIAHQFGVSQPRVRQLIQELRPFFVNV